MVSGSGDTTDASPEATGMSPWVDAVTQELGLTGVGGASVVDLVLDMTSDVAHGVDRPLGEDRARQGRDGDEQQEEQRGAHRGQLAPREAEQPDRPELRLGDVVAVGARVRGLG